MEPATLVRFEMTKEDLIAFNLYHQKNSPSQKAQRRNLILGFVVFALVLAVVPFFVRRMAILWGVSAFFVLVAGFLPSSFEKSIRKMIDKLLEEGRNKGLLGLKEVSITPTAISTVGALRSMTIQWPAVERIVAAEDSLYVYVSAIEAIIVPRRAFEKPEEFEAFAAAARKYQAEAAGRSK